MTLAVIADGWRVVRVDARTWAATAVQRSERRVVSSWHE